MFTFPESVSKLVFQYPTEKQVTFSAQVLRFLGGGEQRYAIANAARHWKAQPVLLPDKEMSELAEFFLSVGGSNNPFQFTDPWDGTVYPACYFKEDVFESTCKEPNRTSVLFTILEGRTQP